MAQRTVARLSLAQLTKAAQKSETSSQDAAPFPRAREKPNTFYIITEHITGEQLLFNVIFGPVRSLDEALRGLVESRPRTAAMLAEMPGIEWAPQNHFRWTEPNGDRVLIKIEQETNAAVFATDDGHELFFIVHRVTNFDDRPVSEVVSLGTTHLTRAQAAVAALNLFRDDIEGRDVDKEEVVKPDKNLFLKAQSKGEGGFRWTVEVSKGTWA